MTRRNTKHGFRPKLETLEERLCLACDVFKHAGTLFCLGDGSDNQIEVVDLGHGKVTVACDGAAPRTFHGIHQVEVASGDGADLVSFRSEDSHTTSDKKLKAVRIDLGAGNDRAELRSFNQEERASFLLSVSGNLGDDIIDALVRDLKLTARKAGSGQFSMSFDGGEGDNRITTRFERPWFVGSAVLDVAAIAGGGSDFFDVAFVDPVGEMYGHGHALLNLAMAAGDGQDAIQARLGAESQPVDRALRLNWRLSANGGGDDDSIDVLARDLLLVGDPNLAEASMFALDGGEGNNRITARFERPWFVGPAVLDVVARAGGGADFFEVSILDPVGAQYGAGRARLNLGMFGGGGSDLMRLRGGVQDRPADLGLQLDWNLRLNGERGDDVVDAQLQFDPAGLDRITATVLGDDGDDDLTLKIKGLDERDPDVAALVDGGLGFDTAHVTRNVDVRNCEIVLFDDEIPVPN